MTDIDRGRPPVVVMGVSGCGKSTVARALARRWGVDFADADDLHSPQNVAAMAAGRPLDDEARAPWLAVVARWLGDHQTGGVMACSALRRRYRDVLRSSAPAVVFLHLDGDPALIARRVSSRPDHFMPPALLASQLQTLEPLGPGERGLVVDLAQPPDKIVTAFATWCAAVDPGT